MSYPSHAEGLGKYGYIIIIYHHHYHQHVLKVQIPLSFSHYLSLLVISFGKFSRWRPVSTQNWWMWIFAGQSTLMCPCVGVHRRTSHYFILTSPRLPSSSYLDGLWDVWWVAVQLLFCRVLLPGFVHNNT